ncbi:MAG: hypothetical protein KJZ90_05125 [Rhodocyclaceae bacterium]|nr:hypothetical protein [Rhodocyclaceae bacterium]
MLERLKLIFTRQEPETSAGLLLAREELEAARVAAVEALRRVQAEKNAALVEAIAADDDKARASLRKSLAAAQAELDEITGALAGLDARIEAARTTEAAQAAVEDAAQRAALARQREEAASAMQHALESLADAFKRFDALGRRIEGTVTRREIERRAVADFDLQAAVSEQLQCRTAGRLGDPRVLRTYTLHEFQRAGLLVDLPELAKRQNARLGLTAPDLPRAA